MEKLQQVHETIGSKFLLDNETLRDIMIRFEREVNKGLSKTMHNEAEVKCFVTYVQNLPKGTENGKFLALDLGGTNFRVLFIHLNGEAEFEQESKIYAIPQSLMIGHGDHLFDYIAKCLAEFAKEMNIQDEVLPLGFTFSFPVHQHGLTEGVLVRWTKGFQCEGVVEKNVVELLEAAIAKRDDIKILVCAILNDTVGTLMSCAWRNKNCKIGVILGTGSNACYLERASNAELLNLKNVKKDSKVVINLEWGPFGEKSGSLDAIRTIYDVKVDENSMHPKEQPFEKMISGMYLGEIVRRILVDLTNQKILFDGILSDQLNTVDLFYTKYISEIEEKSDDESIPVVREIMQELGYPNVSDEDCLIVRFICECVSTRSIYLVSAAIAVLLLKIGDDDVTIGVDGSLYRYHPHFHSKMTKKIAELTPKSYSFELMLSEDGSGRGAAVVAAVASNDLLNNK